MKKYKFILFFSLLIFCKISFCDIIPANCHSVSKCVMITNIDDYPEISFIASFTSGSPARSDGSYLINSTKCLYGASPKVFLCLFAVRNTYLQGKDVKKIDWLNDKNAIPFNIHIYPSGEILNDSIPIYSIEQFYKILGFTETTVVLFMWSEVLKDKIGYELSENEFIYDGDTSKLSQQLHSGINSNQYSSTFSLYPNPAQQVVSLKISNFYEGTVPVEIVSFGGKVLKSTTLYKTGFIDDSTIPIENLPKGIYFVTIRFGAMVETQKLLIN